MLAIIPAKSLSKRLPNKNIKKLAGKPLIAYTIECALKSKKIKRLIVSTDSKKLLKLQLSMEQKLLFLEIKNLQKIKLLRGRFLKIC